MSIPTILAIFGLIAIGTSDFLRKVGASQKVDIGSFMVASSAAFMLATFGYFLVQGKPFILSLKMTGVAASAGFMAAAAVIAMMIAFSLGGEASRIVPIVRLGLIVTALLSFIVFKEPITLTNVTGLGLGVTTIYLLTR